jgi:hypothetical protein
MISHLSATLLEDSQVASLRSSSAFLDLGQHAKLKGVLNDPLCSLETLSGHVLKQYIPPNPPISTSWNTSFIQKLHEHVEAIWQVYSSLISRDSVGLPLVTLQSQEDGFPVTVFHADKAVAEGTVIWPHPSSISVIDDEEGNLRKINITPSRSLVRLSKILVPGSIHRLHSPQSMDWIFNHGQELVATTSTLRSRNPDAAAMPAPSASLNHTTSLPAPDTLGDTLAANIPEFEPSLAPSADYSALSADLRRVSEGRNIIFDDEEGEGSDLSDLEDFSYQNDLETETVDPSITEVRHIPDSTNRSTHWAPYFSC